MSEKKQVPKSKQKKVKTVSYGAPTARRDLPQRRKQDNKTSGGKVLIVAGSPGMWGAQQLSAEAASRCGAGYVYCLTPPLQKNSIAPDFLTLKFSQIKKMKFSACVIGPGFKEPKKISSLLRHWLKTKQQNVVLDAEALNWLAQHSFPPLPSSWVITPHEGEMARLLNISSQKVRKNRESSVLETHKKYGGVVLLKGADSLVFDGQKIVKIKSGNAALAKAGSGDVLAGMIGAFLSQRPSHSPGSSVSLATFIHGAMADQWLQQGNDILSLRPIDLIKALPQSIHQLRSIQSRKTE